MAMEPVYSLEDLAGLLEDGDRDLCAYYGVLLYTAENGLDGLLHRYVRSHWTLLNRLTGDNALLFALEDLDRRPIERFRPEDVYEIARLLGASVADIPTLVFFTDPVNRQDTTVVRLRDFLPPSAELDEEGLTEFFRGLQAIIDDCCARSPEDRLECLQQGLDRDWPTESPWGKRTSRAGAVLAASATVGSTILQAVMAAAKLIAILG